MYLQVDKLVFIRQKYVVACTLYPTVGNHQTNQILCNKTRNKISSDSGPNHVSWADMYGGNLHKYTQHKNLHHKNHQADLGDSPPDRQGLPAELYITLINLNSLL